MNDCVVVQPYLLEVELCPLGRDDFNLTFMIFFGELLYDVGYQKKHIRLHGRG